MVRAQQSRRYSTEAGYQGHLEARMLERERKKRKPPQKTTPKHVKKILVESTSESDELTYESESEFECESEGEID